MTIYFFVYFLFFFRLSRSDSQWFFISACWVVLFWWLLIKYWKSLLYFMPYSDEYFSILTHWMLDPWMKWWNGSDMLVKVFMFFFLLLSCYLLVFFSSLSAYSRLQSLSCFPWSFKPCVVPAEALMLTMLVQEHKDKTITHTVHEVLTWFDQPCLRPRMRENNSTIQ